MNNQQPRFFFDTADIDYIKNAWSFLKTHGGFIGTSVIGITSNPNALTKVGVTTMEAFDKHVLAMCKAITEIREGQPGGIVYVQFPQMTMGEESMRKYINHIIKLSDGVTKVGLKIPPYTHVLKMVPEFEKLIEVNVTGVTDAATALKCFTYGVRYVSTLTGRMEEVGINAREQLEYIVQGNLGKGEIITASMRTLPCVAWGIEVGSVPTIGTRVFDIILAKGPEGAVELRKMWDKKNSEFSPVITPEMRNLSLSFFEQMDSLGENLRKSFESKI